MTSRFFPFGFHTSTTANVNGIGAFLQLFADSGIPFVAKCVDGTTSIVDAQNLIKQGATGHAIYRKMTGYQNPPSSNDDVPHYGSDVKQESLRYWNSILSTFPADLDKDITWIEIINEPDTNWASWLGELGYEIGLLALRDGYKILMYGWSTGTPEYDDWLTGGMRKFLTLCADNPDQIGISLHEYSLTTDDLFDAAPYLVGRFQFLHDACDEIGIDHPTIFITEFGYVYNTAPSLNQMLDEFALASALYGIHPNVKGALIWALDKNWGDLDKKIYPLMWSNGISPLFNLVKDNLHEIPDPPIDPPPTQEWSAASIVLADGRTIEDAIGQLELRVMALETTTPPDPPVDPLPLPPGHNYPLGVDVSRYQYENTNWTALKNAGVSFAFIRLGSAYTLKDANFDWNWQNAGLNNILRGAYWYLYPEGIMSISAQVNHVAASIPSSCELPLVLDIEQAGLTSTMVKSFLELFEMQAGYKPIIYTGAWYWVPNMGAAQVWATVYDLWVANYTLGTGNIPSSTFIPLLPDVWSAWKFWQWTSSGGSLVGQSFVPLDLNYFNGTPEQLYQYSANFISSKQPAVQKVNILDFIRGTHQKQFDLDYGTGTQTTQIWHIDSNNWLYIKGENQEYERFFVKLYNGENWIWRAEDTSESPDRWYAHFKDSTLSEIGAPWCPVLMEVNKPYTTGKFVQHFLKSDCSKQNGGNVSDTIKLISNPYQRTYPKYNKTETVITLEWTNGGEFYDFAGGNIGFRDATRDFQFMGWLEGRADKIYKKPTCFNVGW